MVNAVWSSSLPLHFSFLIFSSDFFSFHDFDICQVMYMVLYRVMNSIQFNSIIASSSICLVSFNHKHYHHHLSYSHDDSHHHFRDLPHPHDDPHRNHYHYIPHDEPVPTKSIISIDASDSVTSNTLGFKPGPNKTSFLA